jgi:crossover junction endodeoxyribonuclease RuvC
MPDLADATDALAVALTHFYESSKPQVAKGPSSWAEFLRQNPDRLRK